MNTAKAGYTAADEPTGTYQKEKPLRRITAQDRAAGLKKKQRKQLQGAEDGGKL